MASGLRELATRLARIIDDPARADPRWRSRDFGRRVDRVRGQLAPIASRSALAESFDREASRRSVVATAYAARWLELDGVIGEHPWHSLWERHRG